MKLIEGQLTIFDLFRDDTEEEFDEPSYSIEEFDEKFGVGSRFWNGNNVLEITNIRKGEQSAEIKNVTLELKGLYVGSRYFINKESYGTWYLAIAENGNMMPCPNKERCQTYNVGCYGISYWCGRYGEPKLIDRLKLDGWQNSFDKKPPRPGIYEILCVRDYAFMQKQKMEYKGEGRWYIGGSALEPNYWREVKT